MNLLDMLKSANIFSPTGITSPQQFPVGSIGGPDVPMAQPNNIPQGLDLSAAIQGLLSPRDEQFNNFAQMIQSMPQRSQYPPDLLHKLGGVLAGLGTGGPVGISNGAVLGYKSNIPEGLKVQSAVKDEKYNEALNDWANKLGPIEKISQMEQNRNVGNRATALGTLQRQQAQEKIDEQERRNQELEAQGRRNLDIKQAREEAYVKSKNFAMDHPTYKTVTDENGDLYFYNPSDPNETPIPSGLKQTTALEKAEFQVQGTLKAIEARNKAATGLEGVKQANRVENEKTRQLDRLELKTTPAPARSSSSTSASGPKPLLPTQVKQDQINKALKIISEHPELKGYIVFDKTNSGAVTGVHIPPSGYFGNEQKRMQAYNLLFGQSPVPGVTQTNQPAQNGKVLMLSPDGKTKGYVPQSQHDTAIKQGYKDTK